jgi:hypothetical protein
MPANFFIALLIRDYLQQPMERYGVVQEVNKALESTEPSWTESIQTLYSVLFYGYELCCAVEALDRKLYLLKIIKLIKQFS